MVLRTRNQSIVIGCCNSPARRKGRACIYSIRYINNFAITGVLKDVRVDEVFEVCVHVRLRIHFVIETKF